MRLLQESSLIPISRASQSHHPAIQSVVNITRKSEKGITITGQEMMTKNEVLNDTA